MTRDEARQLADCVKGNGDLRIIGRCWSIRLDMTLEADAGYVMFRRFDYIDKHLIFRSDPAPYAQLAFRVRF